MKTHKVGETMYTAVYNLDALELLENIRHATIVFLDPPFNIGQAYEATDDAIDSEAYLRKLRQWIQAGWNALGEHGSLWLNLPDALCWRAAAFADELGAKLENWCIWHYRFAVCQPYRFLRSKSHALWFSKGSPIVNAEAALVPSDRATLYNDDRTTLGTRMDFDVWGFDKYWGRIQGNNLERGITPNQLPEKYLQRVVSVCSNESDMVIDPFCGSGTTATVCQALKRRCITGDISRMYCETAVERIKRGTVLRK